jgi:hypothetical protein
VAGLGHDLDGLKRAMVRKLYPLCGNIVLQLGYTMQFEEAECSSPGVVVVASSSVGGSCWMQAGRR